LVHQPGTEYCNWALSAVCMTASAVVRSRESRAAFTGCNFRVPKKIPACRPRRHKIPSSLQLPPRSNTLATRIKCWQFDQPPQNCVMRGSGLRFAEDAKDVSVPSLYVICSSAISLTLCPFCDRHSFATILTSILVTYTKA
jgi:hypothetical protein